MKKINLLYLMGSFPFTEYLISQQFKLICNYNIYACNFSMRFGNDILKFDKENKIFSEVFNFPRYAHTSGIIKIKNIELLNKELSTIESNYNIPFSRIKVSDKLLNIIPDEIEIKNRLLMWFNFIKKIIDEKKINVVLGELSSATFLIAYYYALFKNIKYIYYEVGRINNTIAFCDLEGNRIELEEAYINNLKNGLPDEELRKTLLFIDSYIKGKTIPEYMEFSSKITNPTPKMHKRETIIESMCKLFYTYKIDKNYADQFNVFLYTKIKSKIKSIIRFISKKLHNKYFDYDIKVEENFLLFPLHFQPEASTSTFAPFYMEQLYVIKNISKLLPINFYLYVKEHPAMYSEREISFYKEIKNLYNVKLVSPTINIHKLLKNCRGIVSLTNTTGWEGILYDKPVFLFGNVFYQVYNYAYKFESFYHCESKIKEVLAFWEHEKEKREPDRLAFINAVLNNVFPGKMNASIVDPTVLDKNNITNLVNSISLIINK